MSEDVRNAFETALLAITPALPTAWENQAFDAPAPSSPYQQAFLLRARPDNPEFGPGFRDQGILQINLQYPIGFGTAAVEARARAIRDAFPRGLTLTHSSVVVTIDRTAEIGNGTPDNGRWMLPVRVFWHANQFS